MKKFLFITIFVFFILLSSVSASDSNLTDYQTQLSSDISQKVDTNLNSENIDNLQMNDGSLNENSIDEKNSLPLSLSDEDKYSSVF